MQDNKRQNEFQRHWVRWQPRIYAYIRTVIFRRTDAEDMLQDVAGLLWQKFDEFEDGTRFDQWAYAVTRNKLLNFQKKKKRERTIFSKQVSELVLREAVDEDTQSNDRIDALQTCIKKLNPEQRDLLSQRYEHGATNRSIAKAADRTESTISRKLNKIYGSLMICIDACLARRRG